MRSRAASACGEEGILLGFGLPNVCISATENDGFTPIFPHSVVKITHSVLKALSLPWVSGGHDFESPDFVAQQVGIAGHHNLADSILTDIVYAERDPGPL